MRPLLLLVLTIAALSSPARASTDQPTAIRHALARGVAYLLEDQNADGSWGSPARTLHVDI